MHRLFGATLVAILAFAPATPATSQEEVKPFKRRIVGGEKTDIKQHPWQVALNVKIDGQTYLCGGSLIAHRWVVTAAHCFRKATAAGDVRAKAGVTDYVATGTWANIERVVLHHGYDSKTQENDIALVKLKAPPPATGRVIPLASASIVLPAHQPLEVTGWGATEETGVASRVLLKASVPYTDPTECNSSSAYGGSVKAGMMCAGYRDGGMDACQGDSGGPLVWRTGDGPILVGIVSWGVGCARKLKYGIYTRVSAYRSWIDGVLKSDR